jgi:hypothetical protein
MNHILETLFEKLTEEELHIFSVELCTSTYFGEPLMPPSAG